MVCVRSLYSISDFPLEQEESTDEEAESDSDDEYKRPPKKRKRYAIRTLLLFA